jgi:PHD/YefM family antitoxin component YafN of YafNO toxin-antitoxin module
VIKTQIIKENNKPIAVIMDYEEYKRLKEAEEDRKDYSSAVEAKKSTKKWTTNAEMKKKLGIA